MRFSQDIVIITRKMVVYVLIDCLTYSAKHCMYSQDKNIFNNMYIFYMVLEKWETKKTCFDCQRKIKESWVGTDDIAIGTNDAHR